MGRFGPFWASFGSDQTPEDQFGLILSSKMEPKLCRVDGLNVGVPTSQFGVPPAAPNLSGENRVHLGARLLACVLLGGGGSNGQRHLLRDPVPRGGCMPKRASGRVDGTSGHPHLLCGHGVRTGCMTGRTCCTADGSGPTLDVLPSPSSLETPPPPVASTGGSSLLCGRGVRYPYSYGYTVG